MVEITVKVQARLFTMDLIREHKHTTCLGTVVLCRPAELTSYFEITRYIIR